LQRTQVGTHGHVDEIVTVFVELHWFRVIVFIVIVFVHSVVLVVWFRVIVFIVIVFVHSVVLVVFGVDGVVENVR
jgi:hypothetical protein